MATKQDDKNSGFSRWEKYGLSTVILCAIAFWVRPHLDTLFSDHRTFLQRTGNVLERQTEIQAVGVKTLENLERRAEESEGMIRDLHGHIIGKPIEPKGPEVSNR